ncbi:MAG: pilus assembly protein TadE [Sphingomonas sp. 28-66-16]|nr:MAG: pilus assembly protein TadE [Sphingomonas sp. 28-66-16]
MDFLPISPRDRRAPFLRAIVADQRGATIIEFAFVAAPLMALLMAILVTSTVYFAQAGLETATEATARVLMTGTAQRGAFSAAQFKQAACNALPPFMSCNNLLVDVQSASAFSSIATAAPTITFDSHGNVSNSFAYTPGNAGDIVVIRLMYIWKVPTGPLGFNVATLGNGQRLLMATSVAKTEPFS